MPVLSLTIILICVGIGVYLFTAASLADALLKPPRMNDGKALYLYKRLSPADLHLNYSDIQFDVRTRGATITIAGWWCPAPTKTNRCVLLIHGYADGKVGAIGWGPLWNSLGFNVCAIDLRAHGVSGGRFCTAGVLEGEDLASVIASLRTSHQTETMGVYLFGISMGAAIALRAAQVDPTITGVILESPYADFVSAARITSAIRAMPSGSCFSLAASIAQFRVRINYHSMRTTDLLPSVDCPVMWIYGEADRIVDPNSQAEIRAAIANRKNAKDRMLAVAGADHLATLFIDPAKVTDAIVEFTCHLSETS